MGIRKKILLAIAKQSQPQKFPIGQYYPNIFKNWEQNYLNIFQQIVNITNLALFYLSETQLSFLELKQNNFSINPNEYSFNNLPKIITFSKFLNQLLNSNNLTNEQKDYLISQLKQNISNLPDGSLSTILQQKINGQFKSLLQNLVNNI